MKTMKVDCPNCGHQISVNGLGRKTLNITVSNVCDALQLHHSVSAAANELGCSRAYIYKILEVEKMTVSDVIRRAI